MFIDGMSCDHCIRAVDRALRSIEGVERVEVELGHATIEASDAVSPAALRAAVEAEGYRPKP
jgi:copper chaperone CopZ